MIEMSNSELMQLEQNIKQAQKSIDLGNALERLKTNKDFKKVISEGYFEKEAIRLVHLRADSNMQSVDSQKSINTQIDAIGTLSQYFQTVYQRAQISERSLASDEQTLEELLAEVE